MKQQLFTIPEAAGRLRVTSSGLRSCIREGKVSVIRLGRLVRISEDEIDRVMKEGLTGSNRGT
jgi:excisionase family DNA binding protein